MTKRLPLSTIVAEDLAGKIRSGRLEPGAKLPTEAALCQEYDVSRTVVREAVARLRSDGIVIPQQGRGMFVTEAPSPRSFSIPEEMLRTLPETIALLELRLSVEVEAAGLCAERRSDDEANAIRRLMEDTDARRADPQDIAIHYDYDFHLAIARATRNALLYGFLDYLRPLIVPRFQLAHIVSAELKDAYYARVHDEHLSIVDAITRGRPAAARDSMRLHLTNSLARIRAMAAAAGLEDAGGLRSDAADQLIDVLSQPLIGRRRRAASRLRPGAAPDRPDP